MHNIHKTTTAAIRLGIYTQRDRYIGSCKSAGFRSLKGANHIKRIGHLIISLILFTEQQNV